MTDPHVDFYYTPGTIADCNMPLCCRPENGFTSDPLRAAGEWGSYLCDIPHKLLSNMLEYIRDEIKPDLLVWTGDNSAHNVWDNTQEEIISYVQNITETVFQTF